MSRLIEIDDTAALPARITLGRADVLLIRASGGQVVDGPDLLEVFGPFVPAVVTDAGRIISPEGPPNTLFFVARKKGEALVELSTGDPYGAAVLKTITVVIE